MAGAPYRLVTLPDGTQRRMPSSQVNDYINNTFLPNQSFQNSADAPIPGLTGPTGPGASIPGMSAAPPQWNGLVPSYQQLPTQSMSQMPMGGPYGMQAMRMAGLLGNGMSMGGLLGKGYRIPGIK